MTAFVSPPSTPTRVERARAEFARLGAPQRSAAGVGALVVGGAGIAAIAAVAGTDTGPELCVLRHWFGGYCPGCGGARAARHLVHGDLASAWADHPWMIFGAVQLVVVAIAALVALITRPSPLPSPHGRGRAAVTSWRWSSALTVLAVSNLVLLVGIWVARLANGSIPSPF